MVSYLATSTLFRLFTLVITLLLGLVLLVLALLWAIWTFNRLVRARNQQAEAWSGIEVQLRKRHDLVPPLVAAVRAYAAHEAETFAAVTAARNQTEGNPNRTDEAERAVTQGLRQLLAVAEAYPILQADENFRQLSTQLISIEDDLQYARRYFNGSVRDFRNLAQTFPHNLLAGLFRFTPGEFFEVESSLERQPPKVG
jgi:LemA protein